MNHKKILRKEASRQMLHLRQKHIDSNARILENYIHLLINVKSHGVKPYIPKGSIYTKWLSYIKGEESTPSLVAHSIIEMLGYCSFQPKHPTRKKSLQLQ